MPKRSKQSACRLASRETGKLTFACARKHEKEAERRVCKWRRSGSSRYFSRCRAHGRPSAFRGGSRSPMAEASSPHRLARSNARLICRRRGRRETTQTIETVSVAFAISAELTSARWSERLRRDFPRWPLPRNMTSTSFDISSISTAALQTDGRAPARLADLPPACDRSILDTRLFHQT